MTIAVLGGTGKEGRGLALCWARAGRSVLLGSRSDARGREAADELNAKLGSSNVTGMSNRAAANEADIVVSTLPDQSHIEILSELTDELSGKILVTATIAWPPGPTSEPSAAELVQSALGDSVRVVAAFQTVSAGTLAKSDSSHTEDVLICSDDLDAAEQTRALVHDTGLRGVIAGNLSNTRVCEVITGLLLKINRHYGVKSTGIRITGIGEQLP